MRTFLLKAKELKTMQEKVTDALGAEKVEELSTVKMGHSLLCGCGAGGNCASSCVSGCADRG